MRRYKKVMAALPPNVAEKTSQHVSSGEIKARAAARAVVHLSSSTLTGRGLHSLTLQLNVSAFCGIGAAFRG